MTPATVLIVTSAQDQIGDAVNRIADQAPANAFAWERRLLDAIARIGEHPTLYAVDQDTTARLGQTIRKVTFERTYLIFYRYEDRRNVVEVIGFRHGARRPGPHEP